MVCAFQICTWRSLNRHTGGKDGEIDESVMHKYNVQWDLKLTF